MAKRNETAEEGKASQRSTAGPTKERLGREDGSTPPADTLPAIAAISPAFGFIFARRADGLTALYRIAVSANGDDVLHLKEIRISHTKTVISVMVHELRKLVGEGAFRMSELSWLDRKKEAA